jgi:peptidyl-prolyl cis-trans isomerase A (cyclophilin A)
MQRCSQFSSTRFDGAVMRRELGILFLIFTAAVAVAAQSGTTTQAAPASGTAAQGAATHPAPAKPYAVIDTTAGKMTCTLFPDKAPIGVQNFVGLATGTKDWRNPSNGTTKHGVPLYDGTIFHRVIPDFMIQGGDPAGTGSGADPVPPFKNEVAADLTFDRPGRMAYANTGRPSSNSAQFFITEVATPHLNGGYTIFGQCDDATVALVKQIARMATDPSNDKPFRPVKINHITIVRGAPGAAKPAATAVKKPTAAAAPKSASPN